MNRGILTMVIFCACSSGGSDPGWKRVASGTTADLGNLQFVSPSIGYISGYSSAGGSIILKTTDGGGTWNPTTVRPDRFLNAIFFIDADTGFFVGDAGTIMKTTDGGISWAEKIVGSELFWGVDFPTPQTGYACAMAGVAKTTNGGMSWTIVNDDSGGAAVDFFDASSGLIGSPNGGLHTQNGGASWTAIVSPTGSGFTDVLSFASDLGLAVDHAGNFLRSTDGGNLWASQNMGVTSALRGIWSEDGLTLWVVGDGGRIWRSTNGGLSWSSESSGTTELLDDIAFTDEAGFIVGFNGVILMRSR